MLWPLTPRSRATSATFLPDAIRSRTRRLNSGGYRPAMPTSSRGHGHDESNDATPLKWGNISLHESGSTPTSTTYGQSRRCTSRPCLALTDPRRHDAWEAHNPEVDSSNLSPATSI